MNNLLSANLNENLTILKQVFQDCSDFVIREFKLDEQVNGLITYIAGIVQTEQIQQHALRPLLFEYISERSNLENLSSDIEQTGISLSSVSDTQYWTKVVSSILDANAVILLDGYSEAIVLDVRGGIRRSVEEPQTEAVIRGPREGFTEHIGTNVGLVRFKIKSPRLKTVCFTIGEHTQTKVILIYLEGIANKNVIKEVRSRIQKIKIDSVLESSYIEEFIEDHPYSPFPQMQYSERPDTVAAQILEGRFAIITDGSPFVLIAPVTLWQKLQSSEDYYERALYTSLLRWLRYALTLTALYLPSLYIAVVTY
ncbi:MAG: putative spore germination protein, partial [Bacilli bacterium]|nr:putative spore germination protein [Bacilli bacterium]